MGNINGSFGMRTTLPGFDARNDDPSDPTKFSFNTDWNDIVYIDRVGYVNPPSPVPNTDGPMPGSWIRAQPEFGIDGWDEINSPWLIPVVHGLPYRAYVEARASYPNGVIYDDYRRVMVASNGVNTTQTDHSCGNKAWSEVGYVKINTWEYTALTITGNTPSYSYTYYGHRVAFVIFRLPL